MSDLGRTDVIARSAGTDRRRHPRKKIKKPCLLMADHMVGSLACLVEDLSPGDAQIAISAEWLPSEFSLKLGKRRYNCFVRWRKPSRIGVQFQPKSRARLPLPEAIDPPEPSRPSAEIEPACGTGRSCDP